MSAFRNTLAALLLLPGLVLAAQFKIATVAPDGSAWMREMRAAGDEIKAASEGRVELKFYPGGVMGSDATVLRKIRVGQLQGGAFTGTGAEVRWDKDGGKTLVEIDIDGDGTADMKIQLDDAVDLTASNFNL